MKTDTRLRIARPTEQLKRVVRFYVAWFWRTRSGPRERLPYFAATCPLNSTTSPWLVSLTIASRLPSGDQAKARK